MADKKGAAQARKGFSAETEQARKHITKTGMSEEEKVALEVLLSTMPMAAALKTVSAARKALKPASKTMRKRAKADKARKKEAESSSKTRQKEDAKLSKRVKKESLRKRKTAQKDKDKRMAARKREREGMSDHEKIKLGLVAVGGGTYAALRNAFPDPLSMGERNKRIAEEKKKAITEHGGYTKKYANGGGVRKVRR
tara:strand:- start:16 stop:606 length:591 start_codon:yes stop_codon:yes gene_type:complete